MGRRSLSGLSDPQLAVLAGTAGDADAYGELARRHQASLRAFLWRLTGDGALAEDLAQDTLIRGFEHLARFRGGSTFRTWLFSIAYREFLQARRRSGATSRMLERLDRPEQGGGTAPGDALDLQKALASLSDPERAAVLLCDACGLSHAEAAEAMDAPLGSVKTYVRRARARMQAVLARGDADGDS